MLVKNSCWFRMWSKTVAAIPSHQPNSGICGSWEDMGSFLFLFSAMSYCCSLPKRWNGLTVSPREQNSKETRLEKLGDSFFVLRKLDLLRLYTSDILIFFGGLFCFIYLSMLYKSSSSSLSAGSVGFFRNLPPPLFQYYLVGWSFLDISPSSCLQCLIAVPTSPGWIALSLLQIV